MDADSTLARSCGETTVETATKVLRIGDLQGDLCSTLARSCGETTIQAPTKLLRLDLGEAGSTLARSCGETTIQPPTKVADARRNSVKDARDNRDTRDSASEGHTMAERDLGSTLRLPAQHPPLYSPDRVSYERNSSSTFGLPSSTLFLGFGEYINEPLIFMEQSYQLLPSLIFPIMS